VRALRLLSLGNLCCVFTFASNVENIQCEEDAGPCNRPCYWLGCKPGVRTLLHDGGDRTCSNHFKLFIDVRCLLVSFPLFSYAFVYLYVHVVLLLYAAFDVSLHA
jgi:hypothetical protein